MNPNYLKGSLVFHPKKGIGEITIAIEGRFRVDWEDNDWDICDSSGIPIPSRSILKGRVVIKNSEKEMREYLLKSNMLEYLV